MRSLLLTSYSLREEIVSTGASHLAKEGQRQLSSLLELGSESLVVGKRVGCSGAVSCCEYKA